MDLGKINAYNDQKKAEAQRQEDLATITGVGNKVQKAVEFSTAKLIADKRTNAQKVDVQNNIATSDDIKKVVDTLEKLGIILNPDTNKFTGMIPAMDKVYNAIQSIPSLVPESPDPVENVSVNNLSEFNKYLKPLIDAVNSLELSPIFDPRIEVKPADVKVNTEKIDIQPLLRAIESLGKEVSTLTSKEQPATDITPLVEATMATTRAINSLKFPVPNYILPFKNSKGAAAQASLNSSGALIVANSSAQDFDYVDVQQTNATTETYVFKTGGSGGTVVRTIVVVYTSATKNDIDNVTWS